ncbi:unnamed protein product [Phytomonas sp. Hart1]|nr:unnamed protein product [Phytomonas sp. Hart1]|eukprot:CCW68886.1 unnamed protein product [Phytomonas sp. isolate Hart1]
MNSNYSVILNFNSFNNYITNVSNRDRVMSVLQYTTMALYQPIAASGCPGLSANLNTIHHLCSQYRAITRFSQWFVVLPQLTPHGICDTIISNPTPQIGILKVISTAFFTVFLLGEEVCLFAKNKMISPEVGKKFNRIRFVFLFWSNVARLIMNYLLLKRSNEGAIKDSKSRNDHQRKVLNVADGILMTLFTYGLLKHSAATGLRGLPKAIKSGDLVNIVTSFAPPVKLHDTPHGILGVVAAFPGFVLSFMH